MEEIVLYLERRSLWATNIALRKNKRNTQRNFKSVSTEGQKKLSKETRYQTKISFKEWKRKDQP